MLNKKNLALIVDDEEQIAKLMSSLLRINNIDSVQALTYKQAIIEFNKNRFDIAIIDYYLPDESGEKLIKVIREKEKFTPILVFSGAAEEIKLDSYAAGANFVIPKPFSETEFIMVVKNLISLSEAKEDLEDAKNIIEALGRTLEARDTYTEGHGKRVAELSIKFYEVLDLNDRNQKHSLFIGSLLHDIGKIGIPDKILKSGNDLTEAEFNIIKSHPDLGFEICKNLSGIKGSLDVIKYHHERLDGSGYPDGLIGDEIPILAQITSIADVYDAMTTERTYRNKMSKNEAIKIIKQESQDGKFDKKLTEKFIEMLTS